MPRLYVDTSAAVKYFKDEPGSGSARRVFDLGQQRRLTFYSSEWILNELFSAFGKTWRQGLMTVQEATAAAYDAADVLEHLMRKRVLRLLAPNRAVRRRALAYGVIYGLAAGDALHLSTAVGARADTVWTSDENFMKAATAERLTVVDASDDGAGGELVARLAE